MTPLTPLMPADVAERLKARRAILIDIRESDEFAREHVSGAVHEPLSRFDALAVERHAGRQEIYTCRTGNRTGVNGVKLAACVPGEAFVLEGGLDAWTAQGLPIQAGRAADRVDAPGADDGRRLDPDRRGAGSAGTRSVLGHCGVRRRRTVLRRRDGDLQHGAAAGCDALEPQGARGRVTS